MRLFLIAVRITALLLAAAAVCPANALAQDGPVTPAARAADALPSDYVIGPEDVLGVLFWRDEEMSGDVMVRPDGVISLPLLGEMRAAGKRPDDLRAEIQAAAEKYFADANVMVVVRQINSRQVYITGEVATPGAYPLTGPRTVMQLIALAGGLTEYADTGSITIMRVEQEHTRSLRFNYRDVARGRNLQQNVFLQPGDTVVVP